jgi:sucrose phosphorylase
LIPPEDIQALVDLAAAHGGRISYRTNPDGSQSPYELNINYFDALSDPASGEEQQIQIDRFIAAHAIMFSLVGVPGIYFHSLTGSRGWAEGILETGRNRTINRQKLALDILKGELADPTSLRSQVFRRMKQLLDVRASQPAFNPYGEQQVLDIDRRIFAVRRISPNGEQSILCLQNISAERVKLHVEQLVISGVKGPLFDLLAGGPLSLGGSNLLEVRPYQTIWLTTAGENSTAVPVAVDQASPGSIGAS